MNATGAELMAFYEDWPIGPDFYHDAGMLGDDGNLHLNPDEEYDVVDAIGDFAWQGKGKQPKSVTINGVDVLIPEDWSGPPTVDVFKAWRGDRIAVRVLVPGPELEALRSLCAEHGWKVP